MYYDNPEKIWLLGGFFNSLMGRVDVPGRGSMISRVPTETQTVTFLTGCAVLITRSAYEILGPLDPAYFFYVEDLDYALRAQRAGIRLLSVPRARAWHKIEDTGAPRTSPFVLYHLARSSVLLYRRRFSFPYSWYGVMLQVLVYTPLRFCQILRGGSRWSSALSWLRGLRAGMVARLE